MPITAPDVTRSLLGRGKPPPSPSWKGAGRARFLSWGGGHVRGHGPALLPSGSIGAWGEPPYLWLWQSAKNTHSLPLLGVGVPGVGSKQAARSLILFAAAQPKHLPTVYLEACVPSRIPSRATLAPVLGLACPRVIVLLRIMSIVVLSQRLVSDLPLHLSRSHGYSRQPQALKMGWMDPVVCCWLQYG